MSATSGAGDSLLGENVRRLLRQVFGDQAVSTAIVATPSTPFPRRSNGLREFWRGIESDPGSGILDLGSASQANLSFITGLGYKLYTEDLFRALLRIPIADKSPAGLSEEDRFFRENLNYSDGQFSGILCWDLLDFLAEPLVKPLVECLYYFLQPGGNLLTFFHTGTPGQDVPVCQYRIRSSDTLEVSGRGSNKLRRHFNNRAIENLFRKFSSVKFYLSRDSLREVVIVR